MRARGRAALGAVIALGCASLLPAGSASAATTDAVSHCGATSVNLRAGTAVVPKKNQFKTFSTSFGTGSVLFCGNGTSWGAVHIEVKHKPPTWAVADRCAEKVETYGVKKSAGGGKTRWELKLGAPDKYGFLVMGDNGVITVYVTNTGWSSC
jgi:hypothetical protein